MKKATLSLVLLCAAGLSACNGASGSDATAKADPKNLLLGSWTLLSPTNGMCSTHFQFAAKTQTQVSNGKTVTVAVTYAPNPTVVWVMTDAGMAYHTTWIVLDPNKMKMDIPAQCTYQRD